MNSYFFTFGTIHLAPKGTEKEGKSLFRYYVTVEADNMEIARGIMFARYKDKWAFCYEEVDFQDSIGQFNLTEYERIIQDPISKAV